MRIFTTSVVRRLVGLAGLVAVLGGINLFIGVKKASAQPCCSYCQYLVDHHKPADWCWNHCSPGC